MGPTVRKDDSCDNTLLIYNELLYLSTVFLRRWLWKGFKDYTHLMLDSILVHNEKITFHPVPRENPLIFSRINHIKSSVLNTLNHCVIFLCPPLKIPHRCHSFCQNRSPSTWAVRWAAFCRHLCRPPLRERTSGTRPRAVGIPPITWRPLPRAYHTRKLLPSVDRIKKSLQISGNQLIISAKDPF